MYEIPIAANTPQRAIQISELTNENSRAFRNITVSTHSLTTLAKAKTESIHSWLVVTICSTDFLIFFPYIFKITICPNKKLRNHRASK